MKKIGLLSLLVFTSIIGLCQADITVTDTRNFTLNKLNDSGKANGSVTITISGKYKEEKGSKTYFFDFDSVDAKTSLGYPLNAFTLGDSLSKKYKEKHQIDGFFSEYSINQVFLWLYLLNQRNEDGPTIGRLNIGQLTRPEANKDNSSSRIQMFEQLANKTKIGNQKIVQLSNAMKNELLQFKTTLKDIYVDSAVKNDVGTLQSIQNRLKIDGSLELTTNDTAAIANILDTARAKITSYNNAVAINRSIHDSLQTCKNLLVKITDTLKANQTRILASLQALQSNQYEVKYQDSLESIRASFFANLQRIYLFDATYGSLSRMANVEASRNLNTAISKTKIFRDSVLSIHDTIQSVYNSLHFGLISLQQDSDTSKFSSVQRKARNNFQVINATFPLIIDLGNELNRINTLLLNDTSFSKNGLAGFPSKNSLEKSVESLEVLYELVRRYDSVYKSLKTIEKEMRETGISKIEKVSVQFERGHLERVQVWVQNSTGGVDIYENIYAIGFTSISNFAAFQAIRLFERSRESKKYIFLSDALPRYDNLLDLYTRDYSPADTVINEYLPGSGPITLRKERNINLFESKIYTDLEGLNQDKPNGLIQIELAKRFNLLTYRKQVPNHKADFSSLSYLTVFGALTKIEDKQKEFALRNNNTIVNGVIVSPSYISNLDLRRYENLNVGFDLNTFLFDYPTGKFTAYIDFGFRYGHTNLVDTIYTVENGKPVNSKEVKHIDGNTVTLTFPKITFELFSQRRVGFCASYSYNKTYAFTNNQYKQVMSYEKSDLNSTVLEKKARGSHVGELFARVETDREGNGQLFFRTRLFWQQGDANTFFSQIQVGYNYNIIFRK